MALLGVQEPRLSSIPDGDASRGDAAVAFARFCGLTLYPWQEDLLRDMCRTDEAGNWAAREVVTVVARQNGKGEVLVARELAGVYLFGEKTIFHSAHFMDTAIDAQKRLWEVIEGCDELLTWFEYADQSPDGRVYDGAPRKTTGNGKESITFPNGAQILFRTRTKKSGRGLSVELLILDECFDLPNETFAALGKLVRAKERAQTVFISSPVNRLEHMHGAVFSAKRWAGIDGVKRILFKEWSPAPDDRPVRPACGRRATRRWLMRGRARSWRTSRLTRTPRRTPRCSRRVSSWRRWRRGIGCPVTATPPGTSSLTPTSGRSGTLPRRWWRGIRAWRWMSHRMVSASGWWLRCALRRGCTCRWGRWSVSTVMRSWRRCPRPWRRMIRWGWFWIRRAHRRRWCLRWGRRGIEPFELSWTQVSAATELFMQMFAEGRVTHDGDPRWAEALKVAAFRPGTASGRALTRTGGSVCELVAATFAVWGLVEFEIPDVVPDVKRKTKFVGRAEVVPTVAAAEPVVADAREMVF